MRTSLEKQSNIAARVSGDRLTLRKRALLIIVGTLLITGFPVTTPASSPGDDCAAADRPGSEAFDTQGEQVTGAVCASACHGWNVIFSGPRQLPSQWDFIVSDMLARGATATDEQSSIVKRWLKWSWGAVWINSATASDLVAVLGLPRKDAERVIEYREKHGKFDDLESLKAVPGIDVETINARSSAIVFN